MRKIREVLRLTAAGLSARQAAVSLGVARSTVAECLRRASVSDLTWPVPAEIDDAALERLLYPPAPVLEAEARPLPVWSEVHRELQRKGVTLFLLHQEYRERHPDGYAYSRFCDLYRSWSGTIDRVMRQEHRAGEKLFVDYAGQTLPITDPVTGEIRQAQLFVAVLGASNYTFAELTWTQSLPDFLGSHVRALEFFGAIPTIVVPDNLRSAVTRADRYEPDINPSYLALAEHYGMAVIPARVRKPRDKAKVEQGVLLAERWILARLRNVQLYSLTQANAELGKLLAALNHRPFKKLPGTRHSHFEQIDRPAMKPLPAERYEYAEWHTASVYINYHVTIDHHHYSVPHALVGQRVDVRVTSSIVECFHHGQRIASHARSSVQGGYTTVAAHMPDPHRHRAEWTPERLIRWAEQHGPATGTAVQTILKSRRHPEQGFRSAMGVMRLGRDYGTPRLEAACRRALALGTCHYRSLESILKHGLDRNTLPEAPPQRLPTEHDNVRGPGYYQ
jgi:transposase